MEETNPLALTLLPPETDAPSLLLLPLHNVGPSPKKRKQHPTSYEETASVGASTLRRSPRLLLPAPPLGLALGSVQARKGSGRSWPMKHLFCSGRDGGQVVVHKKLEEPSTILFSSLEGFENSFSEISIEMNPAPVPEFAGKDDNNLSNSRSLSSKSKRPRLSEAELLLLSWCNKDERDGIASLSSNPSAVNQKSIRRSPRLKPSEETPVNKRSTRKFSPLSMSDESRIQRSTNWSCKASESKNLTASSNLYNFSLNSDRQQQVEVRNNTENTDVGTLGEEHNKSSPETDNSFLTIDENSEVNHVLTVLPESMEEKAPTNSVSSKRKTENYPCKKKYQDICCLIGDPIPSDEAEERWRWRYELKNQKAICQRGMARCNDKDDEDKIVWNVECHYSQANISGIIYSLGDCAYVKGEEDKKHIGRILEFFKTTDGEDYFRVQWFYKAEETIMQEQSKFHEKRRVFYSTVMNDNSIDCIISKVTVIQIPTGKASVPIPKSGFYYDMEYCVEYSTFRTLVTDDYPLSYESSSITDSLPGTSRNNQFGYTTEINKAELSLLDLFSGCGGMSTGLCLGARLSGINLVTRWALDYDKSACESLQFNHPEAHVRNEAASNFHKLLKEWKKLCDRYAAESKIVVQPLTSEPPSEPEEDEDSSDASSSDDYEVERLLDVCYHEPDEPGECGLRFKVRWKGYDSSEDTWEPLEGLSNCQERVWEFVRNGLKSMILPLPGEVDVICGGPPCQGISGYNRFRNVESPLDDERNQQIIVFMDIVEFLKPRYLLMENVLDILKFDKGSLGRYALSRLVHMNYQARLGIMAAGCYGLPQFRLRVFLWGSLPSEKLPQFPLPTHDVIVRYWPPPEFERNTVAFAEEQPRELEKAAVLFDAISDLPNVPSNGNCEEMAYKSPPETLFQTYIRSSKTEMNGGAFSMNNRLYDHRTYALTEDDIARVSLVPKRKGANFRDLPGVVVGANNVVRRDNTKEPEMLPSGKPLVPDFAFTFEQGKSKRPYGRLWWDETVSTIVTLPDIHSQIMVHPDQDRVLTLRECARLQGFPDYYRFCGTIKERYRQVGNAVAVPVARALGYALGMAFQKISGDEPSMKLPPKFAYSTRM